MSDAALDLPLSRPPAPFAYPSRPDAAHGWAEEAGNLAREALRRAASPLFRRVAWRRVAAIEARGPALRSLDEAALADHLRRVRAAVRVQGARGVWATEAFALIREVAARRVGLRHNPMQLFGGLAILDGHVAEMDTGEGKTLTATLAAGAAAMAGWQVHVVTVNDYLARRDAEEMGPVYAGLGLGVGLIEHGLAPDARRAAYAADIVYASNKELAFDYLRDRLAEGGRKPNLRRKLEALREDPAARRGPVMRGLPFAIVDEADSVLIDEARTPLVISRETSPAAEAEEAADKMRLAEGLEEGRDYRVLAEERRIELTPSGRERVAETAAGMREVWRSRIRREEAARQALSARRLFRQGEHYILREGRVTIVDEYTGRPMPDRSWNNGLHQLLELKEGCEVTGRRPPVARISFQRFFRRYQRLAGMTGTAAEVAGELGRIYGLGVVRTPAHRPPRRRHLPRAVFASKAGKWRAIAAEASRLAAGGRAVLVGTRSVSASEALSAELAAAGVAHVVLNARQDSEEAAIIARAGQPGRITVATNMAGRGVDIRLDESVLAAGGLHVILSEHHEARRIDRQLFGRCARQGQPGSCRVMVSLEDGLLTDFAPGAPLARRLGGARWLAPVRFRLAQRRAERRHAEIRRDLFRVDRALGDLLSFTGDGQ